MRRQRRAKTKHLRAWLYPAAAIALCVQSALAYDALAEEEMRCISGAADDPTYGQWQKPSCADTTYYCHLMSCSSSPCNTCTYAAFRNWQCVTSEEPTHKCRSLTYSEGCGRYVINGECRDHLCHATADSTETTHHCPRYYFEGDICPGALP